MNEACCFAASRYWESPRINRVTMLGIIAGLILAMAFSVTEFGYENLWFTTRKMTAERSKIRRKRVANCRPWDDTDG